jgi:hypothetical protein
MLSQPHALGTGVLCRTFVHAWRACQPSTFCTPPSDSCSRLRTHSPDGTYTGGPVAASWTAKPAMLAVLMMQPLDWDAFMAWAAYLVPRAALRRFTCEWTGPPSLLPGDSVSFQGAT